MVAIGVPANPKLAAVAVICPAVSPLIDAASSRVIVYVSPGNRVPSSTRVKFKVVPGWAVRPPLIVTWSFTGLAGVPPTLAV